MHTITGLFNRYSAAALLELASGLRIGPCIIHRKTAPQTRIGIGIPDSNLDAGPNLALSGPDLPPGSLMLRSEPVNYHFAPTGLNAGMYTITGPGGPDIGPFMASVEVPASFNVPEFPTFNRIDRAVPFTFNWTGGGGGDGVVTVTILTSRTVSGSSSNPETYIIARTTVFCEVPASLGTFTVSPEVLSYLTRASIDPASNTDAYLAIAAMKKTGEAVFRPPLTAGGMADFGIFIYSLGYSRNLAVD